MAVLGRLLMGSGERLDLPDFLSIDSYTASDFKYLIQSLVGATTPYILTGFEVIAPATSIGTSSVSIDIGNSVVYYPNSLAGSFYYGLPEGSPNAIPLVPQLRQNATNFVYLTFNTQNIANDSRAFWDVDENGGAGGEFSQNINTETALVVDVNVSVSTFPPNTIPVCIVVMGPSVIESIEDCRNLMFRLGTGGVIPNPLNTFQFPQLPSLTYARLEPSSTMTSSLSPNAFQGGDKNINTLKQWMDVVMTRIKELGGTTYWYEPGGNNSDIFDDALASTLVSKGNWSHSASIPGQATWNEDIIYTSLNSERNIYIRANTITIPDDYVAWIDLTRDQQPNGSSTPITFQNGSATVNGVIGSFTSLAQGDLIKAVADPDADYLMVEQFYALPNLAGGTTTAAFAQSVLLSGLYQGTTGTQPGSYTKGQYLLGDINITSRSDPSIQAAGSNFYWLAFRSDTQLALSSAITTQLSLTISQGNGQNASIVSGSAHGLHNGDRITITTGPYAGTYQVEVLDTTHFSIQTAITTVDASSETAFYATITTAARSTPYGFVLETADHGFTSGDIATIQGAGSFNGSYQVNTTGLTTFTIPVASNIANPGAISGVVVVLARMNVRTEFGTVKIVQGESVVIGDDPQNLLDYIGMTSLAETQPAYLLPVGYNALAGYQNFNGSAADNLTLRIAQLTAMMADRVQDRGTIIHGRTNITSQTSGANQNISALSNLTLSSPGSSDQIITLTAPIALPANSAIVISTSRNGSGSPLTPTVMSLGNQLLLQENTLILFYRFSDTTVYDWLGDFIRPWGHLNTGFPEDSQNRNVAVFNPGNVRLNVSTNLLVLDVKRVPETTQVTALAGSSVTTGSYFTLHDANNIHNYYVWYKVDGVGTDPAPAGLTGILVSALSTDTATMVATETAAAVTAAAGANITATSTGPLVTLTNVLSGTSTPTVDGTAPHQTTFTIVTTQLGFAPNIDILIPGSANNVIDVDAINTLGTLTLADGESAWVRIDRFNVKTFNQIAFADGPDTDANGIVFVTTTVTVPIDQDVIVLWSRDGNNVLLTNFIQHPDGNVYEEYYDIISGGSPTTYQITGPLIPTTVIQLPPDSRNGGQPRSYIVGSGQLEVFLNGQFLRDNIDWAEIGTPGALSDRFEILETLAVGDALAMRVDSGGAVYFAASSGGGGSLQDAYNSGRFVTVGTGQPIVISGASGKLLVVQGDMEVDGVIDPKGITFIPQTSTPLQTTDYGLWTNIGGNLMYSATSASTINISLDFLRLDGTHTMTAALNMGSNKINFVTDPTSAQDAATKAYVDALATSIGTGFLKLDGTNAMSANLNAGGFNLVNVADPTTAQMAATKAYVDAGDATEAAARAAADLLFLKLDGTRVMTGALDMGTHLINDVVDPVSAQDAATKNYVDSIARYTALYITGTNQTGTTIPAGSVVILSQSVAGQISLANASTLATAQGTVGVTLNSIANGASGPVQIAGAAFVLGTSAFALGLPVYLSTTDGEGSSTAPTATGQYVVSLGIAQTTTTVVLNAEFVTVNGNIYDEALTVVTSGAADSYHINGPVSSGATLTLPNDSRNGGAARTYVVGSGSLQIFLNGDYLFDTDDWSEIGTTGTASSTILINRGLVVGDRLEFRINLGGTAFFTGGGGGGSVTGATNLGGGSQLFTSISGTNLQLRSLVAGAGITVTQLTNTISIAATGAPAQTVTTQSGNYTALSSDNVIGVNAASGPITISLPAASGVTGLTYEIKKIDATSNLVTISPNGSDTIDGVSTLTTSTQWTSFTLVSNGTGWWII